MNYLESIQNRILKKIKETRVKAKKVNEIKGLNEQNFLDRILRDKESMAELRLMQNQTRYA